MGDNNKFYKTKLCQSFHRGRCSNHNCNFAHGSAELRRFLDNPHAAGRREYGVGDLREKLGRRHSPQQRHRARNNSRDRHKHHGHSHSNSFRETSMTRDRKRRKKELMDGGSDFSRSIRSTDGAEDQAKHTSLNSKIAHEEQVVNEVQSDIQMLDHCKVQLGIHLEAKVREADSFMSTIKELEAQLEKERNHCERVTSKIKKFVKARDHYSKVQDELKRSQLRLYKLGEQLSSVTSRSDGDEEDSSINILTDMETTCYHRGNEKQNHPHPIKEMQQADGNFASLPKGSRWYPRESVGFEKHYQLSERPWLSLEKRTISVTNENVDRMARTCGDKPRRERNRESSRDKLKSLVLGPALSPTGMAAYAGVEIGEIEEDKTGVMGPTSTETTKENTYVDGLQDSNLPPPPPLPRKSFSRHEGDDENVDAEQPEETAEGTGIGFDSVVTKKKK